MPIRAAVSHSFTLDSLTKSESHGAGEAQKELTTGECKLAQVLWKTLHNCLSPHPSNIIHGRYTSDSLAHGHRKAALALHSSDVKKLQ